MEINTNLNMLPLGSQRPQADTVQLLGNNRQQTTEVQQPRTEDTQKAKAERTHEELEGIVDKMTESVKVMQRNLNFSIHDNTGTTVVKVMDASSGEVIRQMPTEDALILAERLDEMRSLLFEARA